MQRERVRTSGLAAGAVVFLIASLLGSYAAQQTGDAVLIDDDDIGGVVVSAMGPEAGVWVIAETTDLPTRFSKTVVTDANGRYLLPDLPEASYAVWVRGYGLVDSPRIQAAPGTTLDLTAIVAPDPRAAAEYYPANYWYSLLEVPDESEFPGTGPIGNGIATTMTSQDHYVRWLRADGCVVCHQLGGIGTRKIPESLGTFTSSVDAWDRRIRSGQSGDFMLFFLLQMGGPRTLEMYADWTDRIAGGELPPVPPRPQGVERNVVITQWDWADAKTYLHDAISTDKRNPSVNANGLIYGAAEDSQDYLPVLDPVHHTTSQVKLPVPDPEMPFTWAHVPREASPYWGDEPVWSSHTTVHNPMFDEKGRVWLTQRVRVVDNPAFCKAGSSHPSAKLFPLESSDRHLAVYDPNTKEITTIPTCFTTHHLQFASDANNTLWTSSGGGGGVIGWLNTKMFDETQDAERSQGWTPLVLDANGNGLRDAYVQPDQPVSPMMDKRIDAAPYGLTVSPVDGSIWGSIVAFPGGVIRIDPGSDPTTTALTEFYEVPWNDPEVTKSVFSPRGLDIDRDGVVWTVLSSAHLASFDRRKCMAQLNGPEATGQHCSEGWAFHEIPGPGFKGLTVSASADANYYSWVDQFDTLGLGTNVPIAIGSNSDSLLALQPNGEFAILRVPYPNGFFAKNVDGRIDDPNGGWKGRGLWTTWGTRAPYHSETGQGTLPKVVHVQLRPSPLAN